LVAEKVARNNSETLQLFTHKLKDKDYYKNILNKESWTQMENSRDIEQYQNEMVKLLAKQKVEMGTYEPKGEDNYDKQVLNNTNKLI
jgi:hypothetical protein